jgi:hypothetical protein
MLYAGAITIKQEMRAVIIGKEQNVSAREKYRLGAFVIIFIKQLNSSFKFQLIAYKVFYTTQFV